MFDYVEQLSQYGDIVEQRGVKECGLGEKFPRYAEFWTKYVLTNREPGNPSKLRSDITPELQDIINSHYGVFYQLTIGYYQLMHLSNSLIDISTPLYHFGGAADLIERTVLLALQRRKPDVLKKLDWFTFKAMVCNTWKGYDKSFDEYKLELKRPVAITLHNVGNTMASGFPEWKQFQRPFNQIRHYRNVLIHGLSPLRVRIEDADYEVFIPKEEYLADYDQARWSSDNPQKNHYAPAKEVIQRLADNLVTTANNAWEILLEWMKEIEPQNDFMMQMKIERTTVGEYEESGGRLVKTGNTEPHFYSGGTLTPNIPPSSYPTRPSALHIE